MATTSNAPNILSIVTRDAEVFPAHNQVWDIRTKNGRITSATLFQKHGGDLLRKVLMIRSRSIVGYTSASIPNTVIMSNQI